MSTLDRDASRRAQAAVALGRLLAPFGSGAVPFEASVGGLPPARARASDPRLAAPAGGDVEPTASAWSQRGVARAAPPPPKPVFAKVLVGSLAALGIAAVLGVALVWSVRHRSEKPTEPTASPVVAPAVSNAPRLRPRRRFRRRLRPARWQRPSLLVRLRRLRLRPRPRPRPRPRLPLRPRDP